MLIHRDNLRDRLNSLPKTVCKVQLDKLLIDSCPKIIISYSIPPKFPIV